MAKFEIELDSDGIGALLKSQKAQDMVKRLADDAAARCGDGFESSVVVGKYRAIASVAAVTNEARKRNSEENTILKSIGG